MGNLMTIYDYDDKRFISGEFLPVRESDGGVQLGYFESSDYANRLAIMVLHPNGTYFIAEQLDGVLVLGGR